MAHGLDGFYLISLIFFLDFIGTRIRRMKLIFLIFLIFTEGVFRLNHSLYFNCFINQ